MSSNEELSSSLRVQPTLVHLPLSVKFFLEKQQTVFFSFIARILFFFSEKNRAWVGTGIYVYVYILFVYVCVFGTFEFSTCCKLLE